MQQKELQSQNSENGLNQILYAKELAYKKYLVIGETLVMLSFTASDYHKVDGKIIKNTYEFL